jgi:hypothetical protein
MIDYLIIELHNYGLNDSEITDLLNNIRDCIFNDKDIESVLSYNNKLKQLNAYFIYKDIIDSLSIQEILELPPIILPIPNSISSLCCLSGEVIQISSNYYLKDISGNNRHFLITGYDWSTDIGTSYNVIPYRTNATISAPIGDSALISADVTNGFLYTSGTPNNIPIINFFQNIDYENKIFCKEYIQLLDSNNVELSPSGVRYITIYSAAQTLANLSYCNTFFNVPAITTGALWIDPINGNDSTGNGTQITPYKTFATTVAATATGGTIYIKTGDLANVCTITNKGVIITGIGYCRNTTATANSFTYSNNNSTANIVQGFTCVVTSGTNIGLGTMFGGLTIQRMNMTAGMVIYASSNSTGVPLIVKNSVINGRLLPNTDLLEVYSSYITLSVGTQGIVNYGTVGTANFTSAYNKYISGFNTLLQRKTNTTAISFFNDTINGNLMYDEAIATDTNVIVNYCKLSPNTTGTFMSVVNTSNHINFTITNNTCNQTYTSAGTGFNLKGYNIIFTGNNVINQNNCIITATSNIAGKTFNFSNNICNSIYYHYINSTDYIFTAANNVILSSNSSQIIATAVSFNAIPATIYNNYMQSKVTNNVPFIRIGTEYSTTIDGYMNGSSVYNNRFSGPRDYGNDPQAMHGLFCWSQQVNWHHNYLSGSNLGFVIKSNSGTFAHQIYSNIIKDVYSSFTLKGSKGALIYNNLSIGIQAKGYDGLSETQTGATGDSGNSIVKNNIFYTTNAASSFIITIQDATNATGCVFNNNLYYAPNFSGIGVIASNYYYTLANWQGQGYDTNSVNQNPNFRSSSEFWSNSPITIGENLGTNYISGLDTITNWNNPLNIKLKNRNTTIWQIGAYII